ncbi:Uncharacterised protein [Vibrio cholerae]|nr:Uncharacterised protein [Vibrio cholerae]
MLPLQRLLHQPSPFTLTTLLPPNGAPLQRLKKRLKHNVAAICNLSLWMMACRFLTVCVWKAATAKPMWCWGWITTLSKKPNRPDYWQPTVWIPAR